MQALDPHLSRTTTPVIASRPGTGSLEPLGVGGSVEERSRWLGGAFARQSAGETLHPLDWVESCDVDVRCLDLVEELILSSRSRVPMRGNAPEGASSTPLVATLEWAWRQTEGWDPGLRECLLLKPLMPLYLTCAAAQSPGGVTSNGLTQTVRLAWELTAIVELSRSLEHVGFSQWLHEKSRGDEDVRRLMEQGLQVNLFQVAKSQAIKRGGVARSKIPESSISDSEHQTWWSLAWQWSRATPWLLVPSGVPEVSVPWSQLIGHWKKIQGWIGGGPVYSACSTQEIRVAGDPSLEDQLDRWLEDVRGEQGVLSLITARYLGEATTLSQTKDPLADWQTAWLNSMVRIIEGSESSCFLTESGDVALVYQDLDRKELAQYAREALLECRQAWSREGSIAEGEQVPLIVGIASVEGPAKSFRMGQLQDAAARCLESAALQGVGTVKSIEVF